MPRSCPADLQIRVAKIHVAAKRWLNKRHQSANDAHNASMAEQWAYRASVAANKGQCATARKAALKASTYFRKAPSRAELRGARRRRRRR